MATPKLQNAYRAPGDTDDIADLLLITTTIGAVTADAGASFLAFNNGASDVLVSSAAPLPISAASLPLPTGAASAANQATGNAALAAIQVAVELLDNAINGNEMQVDIAGVAVVGGRLPVDGSGVTQPISAAALPLPAGAATLAEQQSQTTPISRLAGKYVDFDTGAGSDSVVAIGLLLPGNGGAVIGGTADNPLRTDPTGSTTQPVSNADMTAAAGSLNVMDDWDEVDRCKVNLIVGQAGVTAGAGAVAANTPRVTLASDDPAVVSLGVLDDWDEANRCMVNLIVGQAGIDGDSGNKSAKTLRVVLATDQPVMTNAQPVNDKPATSGGLTMHKTISAASTNATSVKAAAGQVYDIQVFNINASPRYLKLYNLAVAPTVGTDTPVKTILIPGNTAGGGVVKNWDKGLEFTVGIAFALTTGVADADTGAVAANELTVNIDYK